jgi:hypothetical protein
MAHDAGENEPVDEDVLKVTVPVGFDPSTSAQQVMLPWCS